MRPEDYFKLGAEAMRTELATRAMIKGDIIAAQKILAAELPKFQVPEKYELK